MSSRWVEINILKYNLPSEFHLKSSVFRLRFVFNALAMAVPASAVKRLFLKSSDVMELLGTARHVANERKPSGNNPSEFHSSDSVPFKSDEKRYHFSSYHIIMIQNPKTKIHKQ